MVRKVGSLLICALMVVLCTTCAFADTEPEYVSLSLYNPYVWVGYYTNASGEPGSLITSQTRNKDDNLSFISPGSSFEGIPWMRINYSKKLSDDFLWNSDYSYLVTFNFYIGLEYSSTPSVFPSGSFFDDSSFAVSSYENTWVSDSYKLLKFDSTSFDYSYESESWNGGDYAGRHETYSLLFSFDDVSSLTGFLYFAARTQKDIRAYGASASYKFGSWNVAAVYDPEGNLTIDESGVQDIIQGQKDSVDYGLEQELSATNSAADDAEDDASAAASNAFDFSSFASALGSLVSALSYTGTDFSFTLPAAQNIPYIGSLWGDTQIPIRQFIDYLPVGLLYIIRFLAWLALLFSVVKMIRTLISDINGGGDE